MAVTQAQLTTAGAAAAGWIGSYFVTKGLISTDQIPLISGFVVAAIALGYSLWQSRTQALINQTSALPVVDAVHVNSQAVVDAAPGNVVKTPTSS